MQIKCLASSSKGNCHLVNLGSGWILLDAGLPPSEVSKHVNINDIDFAFISHEHKDHSKYAQNFHSRGLKTLRGNLIAKFNKISNLGEFWGKYSILGVPLEHGIEKNSAIIVKDLKSNESILYATDFNVCRYDLSKYTFDYIMVECNYLEEYMNDEELDNKEQRQINTHMGLNGLMIFLDKLNLCKCKAIYLMHLSQTHGDPIIMGATIYSRYKITTGVCKQWGGIDYYG